MAVPAAVAVAADTATVASLPVAEAVAEAGAAGSGMQPTCSRSAGRRDGSSGSSRRIAVRSDDVLLNVGLHFRTKRTRGVDRRPPAVAAVAAADVTAATAAPPPSPQP